MITGRNESFTLVLNKLHEMTKCPITIVECGTVRGMGDNNRYGDGWSTYHWIKYCADTNSELYAVDTDPHAIATCNRLVDDYFSEVLLNVNFIQADSIEFLQSFKNDIHLLYLDSYDYVGPEENVLKCHQHQLSEAIAALPNLVKYVLIDDVFDTSWDGKGKLSIPFLLANGFIISHFKDNQLLLEK